MVRRHLMDDDKREICSWKYPGEYAIYNLPSYEELKEKQGAFMNPEKEQEFYGFFEDEVLIGYIHIWEDPQNMWIGIGVHPDYCDRHYGTRILKETVELCRTMDSRKPLCLHVREWNRRAIRCYENCGFQIQGDLKKLQTHTGIELFYLMVG